MNKPVVSVIIPLYNSDLWIERTVKSVLRQTYKDLELILVDDGSTDSTPKTVRRLMENDQRIKYFRQENSGSPAKPQNTGILKSKGRYIAFLDHDDEWLPGKVEEQVHVFESRKDEKLGLVSCGSFLKINGKYKRSTPPKKRGSVNDLLQSNTIMSSSSVMVKKEVFNKVGFFDESLSNAQDWDMWIRIGINYSIFYIQKPLFIYHTHDSNLSSKISLEKAERDLEIIYKKFESHYLNDPSLLSKKLRYDGTRYMLWGHPSKARKCFIKSIKIDKKNFLSYMYIFISMGGVRTYKLAVSIKHFISNLSNYS